MSSDLKLVEPFRAFPDDGVNEPDPVAAAVRDADRTGEEPVSAIQVDIDELSGREIGTWMFKAEIIDCGREREIRKNARLETADARLGCLV